MVNTQPEQKNGSTKNILILIMIEYTKYTTFIRL